MVSMDEVELVRCRVDGTGTGSVGGGEDEGNGYIEAVVNDDTSGSGGDCGMQVRLGGAGHLNLGIKEE